MTIKQVAEKAGVSVASVSNVVNGNYHKVSAETRRKIERIIEETGYTPNAMARSLATQESRIISLVIPYIGDVFTFNYNPYYAELIAELEKYVRDRSYCLMIRCVERCGDIVPMLSSWNVDGVFFAGADYRGGYLSAQHLLNNGHRKIAFAAPQFGTEGVIWQRYCGFCDACKEKGVAIAPEDIFAVDTIESNSVIAGNDIAMSPKKYTAVGVMSDLSACGIMQGLRQCGKAVPDDISVMGFDDLSLCNFSYPKLTTVSQDIRAKACKAGDLLLRMIRDKEELTAFEKISVKLVERDSVSKIK